MDKSIKKLIETFEVLQPGLKIKYRKKHHASIEISNDGGVISIIEPYQLRQRVDKLKSK